MKVKRCEHTSRSFWTDLSLLAETNGMEISQEEAHNNFSDESRMNLQVK